MAQSVNSGKPLFPGNFKEAMAKFDTDADGLVDLEEFKMINKVYPLIFSLPSASKIIFKGVRWAKRSG